MESNLQNMLHACAAQARWHHEQYLRLDYCQRYFTYLLEYREYFNENYLQHLFQKLSTSDDLTGDMNSQMMNFTNFLDTSKTFKTDSPVHKKKRKRKSKVKTNARHTDTDSMNMFTENTENESESGLDLDDGFKQFLKESAKFRAERDSKKNLLKQSDENETNQQEEREAVEVEYVDILRKGPDGSILPPTAENRKLVYEEKYGESGTTILSLETALQWKYNKFADSTSPVTWPALPLRLIYDR